MIWRLVASIALVAGNAFFTAAEFAVVTARPQQVTTAGVGARAARATATLQRDLSGSLAGAQLGITVCSLLLGAVAEPLVSGVFATLLSPFGGVPESLRHTTAFVLGLAVVVFVHLVLGEMVPKNVTIAEPVRVVAAVALPFRAFVVVLRPVIACLNAIANAGTRLFGIRVGANRDHAHTAEELAVLLEESRERGLFDADAARPFVADVLADVLDFGDKDAAAVMVPRTDVTALDVAAPVADFGAAVRATGHSRLPVYDGDLDDVVGFVHAKDLLALPPEAEDAPLGRGLVRGVLVVSETAALQELLVDMRNQRTQIALVVDEHGGTAGIVTIEDVLEELVGEIRDEYDRPDIPVRRAGDGWRCDGGCRPDELEDAVGLALPEGDFETVGGFLLDRLGHLPAVGEEVVIDGWTLRVRRIDGRRVGEVEVVAPAEGP